jgi:diaminopimelate epimerase
MNGLGNDYIFINANKVAIDDPCALSKVLSDRNFAIGGDGLVLYDKSQIADCKMRIFNSDGSEAQMCGNAIRCLGRLLLDTGIVKRKDITIETLSGIKRLEIAASGNLVSVDMGTAKIVAEDTEKTIVDVGNSHAVTFKENLAGVSWFLKKMSLSYIGGINAEAVKVLNSSQIQMRVFERGAGETLACGTGASASAFASYKKGFTCNNVTVKLKGGELNIKILNGDRIVMTGEARYNYIGEIPKSGDYGKIKRKLSKP